MNPFGRGWTSPTFLMYACQLSVCTGPHRSPIVIPATATTPAVNEGVVEHGWITIQSWSEVASFVNQFASGWGASFPTQVIPLE